MIPILTHASVRTLTDGGDVVFVAAVDLAVALLDAAAIADRHPDLCAGESLRSLTAAMTACAGGS